MRVIAGKYRSRRLQTLRGLALRPSSDRLRETLFNIIGPSVQDSVFIDLFAGSGAVGIEALSRGAFEAIFVENHHAGAALLQRNLETLGIPLAQAQVGHRKAFAGTAEIVCADALSALEKLEERGIRADFIFADPPYTDVKAYQAVLEFLGESELLTRNGQVILEHSRRQTLPAVCERLERTRVLEQGDSALSFYGIVLAA